MASSWGGSWASAWGSSWGSIAPTTTDTHDGGGYSRRELDELRRRAKRLEQAQNKSAKRRQEEERKLAEVLEKAFRRVVEGLPDPIMGIPALVAEAGLPVVPTDGYMPPQPDWLALTQDIAAVQRLIATLEMMAADEDDIEMLLLMT